MNEHLRKALDRIKKGEYPKNDGGFTDGCGAFCILGALTREYEIQTGCGGYFEEDADGVLRYVYSDDEDALQDEVARYYGLKETAPCVQKGQERLSVVQWNDKTPLSLEEIAALMEEQEEEICIPEKTALPKGAKRVPVFLTVPQKEKVL
jgi:hypothetical protein